MVTCMCITSLFLAHVTDWEIMRAVTREVVSSEENLRDPANYAILT